MQTLQTKSGIAVFSAVVQMAVEGVEIIKKGDEFIAVKDGSPLGPVVGESVTDPSVGKKVKLTNLVPGIDPATLVGKNFAEMTPAEQAAYVKYLESLAGDKIGTPAAAPAKAEKAEKKEAAKPAAPAEEAGDGIAVPTTLAELKAMGVKEQVKLAKQEGVEGITSRTPKKEVEEKLAAALGLTEEEAPAAGKKTGGKKSEVLKSDEELEDDEDEDDEDEDSDDEDEDSDDESDDEDSDDEDEDEDDDDSDEDEDDDSDDDDDDSDDEDEDEDEDDDSDDEDEDEDDSDDDDSDEDDDEEDEDEDEDEEDEEEATLAKLRKKWTPEKVDALTTKDDINALRKAAGVTYDKGEKVSPVRVKEDIKTKLFGKGKKK